MKNIGLFLGHPCHFHNLKNVAENLKRDGYNVFFAIKKKDILETLCKDAGYEYYKLREGRGNSKLALVKSVLGMEYKMLKFIRKNKVEMIVGSSLSFAASKVARIPSLIMSEDDAAVIPMYADIVYPFASVVLSPDCCENDRWNNKSAKYPSFHELAYLHPNHFTPKPEVVKQYGIDIEKPYFIVRFSSLDAHHDAGIKGISTEIAERLVKILEPFGTIYITSERPLEPQFEKYRIKINPLDMHHVMAFASLYIGDSQTMAAEAGVLGVPFVRFNDFVGRIGYLRELEDTYELGYGIKASAPGSVDQLCSRVEELVSMPSAERKATFAARRQQMLSDKIDCAKFLTWFIEHYPQSAEQTREADISFWKQFK